MTTERHVVEHLRIEEVRLGQRIAGRNPIRNEAELVEPDPATWRQISLSMTKEDGLGLSIELLRPTWWIEDHEAKSGSTIHLDLAEMGAVGLATVTAIGPCPEIEAGDGTVVTGTFKHRVDNNTRVVQLKLEDQIELTGVTANHPYWSEDRRDFVEASQLRPGELVDTVNGRTRVVSVTPIPHDGFIYNLETTEHVYRVGSLGTLVHNSCETFYRAMSRKEYSKEPRNNGLPDWPLRFGVNLIVPFTMKWIALDATFG